MKNRIARAIWTAVVLLVLIAVAVSVRRTLLLTDVIEARPPPRGESFDGSFRSHSALTFLHIIPGVLFLVLAPFQFVGRVRSRYPKAHRWLGRFLAGCGLIVGVTAFVLSFTSAIGGANETAATVFFAIVFLFSLGVGYLQARCRRFNAHREWMIRAFAVGLAIATVRPIVGLFFAFSELTPQEFFGTAFWIGFSIHAVTAEIWINLTRRQVVLKLAKSGAAGSVAASSPRCTGSAKRACSPPLPLVSSPLRSNDGMGPASK